MEKSTRSGIDKAIANLTLGGLYYDLRKYNKAQPCYAEAVPMLPESYPDYRALKKRSDLLDELAVYSQNVELQDSLLRLAAMTPDEQLAVINRIIDELKKKEKEEAEAAAREEFLANRDNGQNMSGASNAPQTFAMSNGDDSWYFYNTATKNAGRTEFQRRWGNRKLEDDWRRRNKSSFNFNDFDSDGDADSADNGDDESSGTSDAAPAENAAQLEKENDPHNPEYYLKQIPSTDEEKQTANDIIQEGLFNMGVILKDKLEDFQAAETEFESLLSRYPDNIYRLDTYYNLYLMFMRAGDIAKAERYRQLMLSEFPESNYGMAMRDPDYVGTLRRMLEQENVLYNEALESYFNNDNSNVHSIYELVRKDFPLTRLMPKFMFLEALAYVTEKNTGKFKSTLMELLAGYPDTDITPYASSYLKGLAQGRELSSNSGNMRGMLWDIRLSNDSTDVAQEGELTFELNPDSEQYLILLFPTDRIPQNALLFEVARHNFASFVVKDFDLETMNFGPLGLLIIKGFSNINEIKHYRQVMAQSDNLSLSPEIRPVVISAKNFDTLLKSGRSFDDYFRYMQDKTYRNTEEAVLPPEIFGESEGMPDDVTSDESETSDADTTPATEDTETTVPEQPQGRQEEHAAAVPDNAPVVPELPEAPVDAPAETPEDTPPAEPQAPTVPSTEPQPDKPTQPAPQEPAKEPEQKPTPKAPVKPVPKPQPKPKTAPQLPEYPDGSEGDDPLLD